MICIRVAVPPLCPLAHLKVTLPGMRTQKREGSIPPEHKVIPELGPFSSLPSSEWFCLLGGILLKQTTRPQRSLCTKLASLFGGWEPSKCYRSKHATDSQFSRISQAGLLVLKKVKNKFHKLILWLFEISKLQIIFLK